MGSQNDNPDPSIIGRRSNDGDYISFREAIKLFATKEELAAMHTSITLIANRVDELPPREELQVRWTRDDERHGRLEISLSDIKNVVDEIRAERLPKWALPSVAIVISVIFGAVQIAEHFLTK